MKKTFTSFKNTLKIGLLSATFSMSLLQAQESDFCPCNYFTNGDFETGTPTNTSNNITLATGWDKIWTGNSEADFYDESHSASTFPLPSPASGNYGSHWIDNYNRPSTSIWREGMLNELVSTLPLNTGTYSFSFEMACLGGSGTSQIAIYAVSAPNGYVYAPQPLSSHNPLNEDLFQTIPGQEIAFLGTVDVQANCDGVKQTGIFTFDTNSLPLTNGITHIAITKSDEYLSGGKYVAFDNFCMQVCQEMDFEPFQPAVADLFPQAVADELGFDAINWSSFGHDKEYGDVDGDGDIDILYAKNGVLHVLKNTAGAGNPPVYNPANSINLGLDFTNFFTAHPQDASNCRTNYTSPEIKVYSFRLYDWNHDGQDDLIVVAGRPNVELSLDCTTNFDTLAAATGVFLILNNGDGTFATVPEDILLDATQFGVSPQWWIQLANDFPAGDSSYYLEISDLNNDGKPDLLLTGHARITGTAYFEGKDIENVDPNEPYFELVSPQTQNNGYVGVIDGIFIPNYSKQDVPEIYNADCDGLQDLFISTHTVNNGTGGGRMYYYQNSGEETTDIFPDLNQPLTNQFGFNDDPNSNYPNATYPNYSNSPLWNDGQGIIVRFVDFFGTGCPIAIAFNPIGAWNSNTGTMDGSFFHYFEQDCSCESVEMSVEDENEIIGFVKPILYNNPVKDHLMLKMEGKNSSDVFSYQIYDLTGKIVQSGESRFENKLNVSGMTSGNYVIRITEKSNSYSLKFIKN